MQPHHMQSVGDVREFILAGNATFTLRSAKTGTRFTYKIRHPEDKPHFVSVLTGSDNESDFTFLGTIFPDGKYKHGARAKITQEAPSAQAFGWFYSKLNQGELHPQLEVWHEGRCGRCGRKLTVPESVENGLGPECIKKVGASHGKGTRTE